MIRTSQPGWNEGAIALSTSRSRRRTRLRTTAPPSFRPVARPNRVASRSVRRKRAVRSGWDRTVPAPAAPRSPADGRASRDAADACRARSSGRQSLPTARPPSGDDTPAAGRAHPCAEAVLLRAMPLLGLVGLLHRDCARSSPLGPGSTSDPGRHTNPPAPIERSARSRPADDMTARFGASNARAHAGEAPGAASSLACPVAMRYSPGVCRNRLATARSGGAILTGPSAPGRSRARPQL